MFGCQNPRHGVRHSSLFFRLRSTRTSCEMMLVKFAVDGRRNLRVLVITKNGPVASRTREERSQLTLRILRATKSREERA
jgi:hypothetical protein